MEFIYGLSIAFVLGIYLIVKNRREINNNIEKNLKEYEEKKIKQHKS